MRWFYTVAICFMLAMVSRVDAQQMAPGYGWSFNDPPSSWDSLDYWRQKRARDFWTRTSPFFGDPLYDPLRTSPRSPYRSPQYHPWGASPFRGDPYYDPYAPRRGRLDYYRPRR